MKLLLGISAPPCGTMVFMIIALRRGKHTDTIFYVVRQNRLHPRERVIVLEIEKGLQKYMEEDHSTPSSHTLLHMAAGLLPMAAAPLSLFFSSLHSHNSLSKHSHIICLLYRHQVLSISSTWREQSSHNTWHELCRNSCFHLAFH